MGLTPKRPLHPALAARALAVKAAHAHLTKTDPAFRRKSGTDQIRHVHRHLKKAGY